MLIFLVLTSTMAGLEICEEREVKWWYAAVYFQCTYGVLDVVSNGWYLWVGYTAGTLDVHSKYTTQRTRSSFVEKIM
jgi:hypothetical protein